jgi:hypothetical protein
MLRGSQPTGRVSRCQGIGPLLVGLCIWLVLAFTLWARGHDHRVARRFDREFGVLTDSTGGQVT